jgi:hypothetical protein
LKSYQQGPLTICEGCGEVLAEAWALQDAVTEIYHEQEHSWVERIRSDQAHPATDPDAPAVELEDRTDPGPSSKDIPTLDLRRTPPPIPAAASTSDFDAALGRLIAEVPPSSDQVRPPEPQFLAVLKPPAFPQFDPTPPRAWAAPLAEPIIVPGRPLTPPPGRAAAVAAIDAHPTPLEIETPLPDTGRSSVYVFVVAAAVAVMLLIGYWLAQL